jgi:CRP-like cAMP-binding protein
LRVAQLVERGPNELICRSGDDGDMMFVLLSGEVGVVIPTSPGQPPADRTPPAVTLAPGDTMGELAFALRRPRTASLVAATDVALLGFKYEEMETRLRNAPLAQEALKRVDRFIIERVLEHLYEQSGDLIPAEPALAPEDADASRREALENAAACTSVLKVGARGPVSIRDLAARDPVGPGGAYLLAGGSLRSASVEGKRVDASAYSLLYVDVPDLVVTPDHHYTVEREAVVLHIGQPAMLALGPDALDAYVAGLRRRARDCYFYDAFLSYAFHDAPVVERWEREMRRQGLRTFRDELRVGHQFPDRLKAALADSLAVVAFVSANTLVRPPEENWVKREVELREQLFDDGEPVIMPVILFGGDVEAIASGHSPVDATGNEEAALATVVDAIRRIRAGDEPAPFARARR